MAGLGRRVFAAGEVLTAGNVMGYLQDQAVMNFAGTAARGSAIGTAVSEGMVSYLADSNVVQAYDGSAWNSLAYASAVPTLAQTGLRTVIPTSVSVGSGSGSYDSTTGLITFTGTSSVTINGVFNSTYANYRILWSTSATTSYVNTQMVFRLRTTTDDSANVYYYGGRYTFADGGQGAMFSGNSGISQGQVGWFNGNTSYGFSTIDLLNPNTGTQASFGFASAGQNSNNSLYTTGAGIVYSATQYTGITLFGTGTGTFTGKAKIYGYN